MQTSADRRNSVQFTIIIESYDLLSEKKDGKSNATTELWKLLILRKRIFWSTNVSERNGFRPNDRKLSRTYKLVCSMNKLYFDLMDHLICIKGVFYSERLKRSIYFLFFSHYLNISSVEKNFPFYIVIFKFGK